MGRKSIEISVQLLHIDFEVDRMSSLADVPEWINNEKIVTILGNLLDNAFESVLDRPEEERRAALSFTAGSPVASKPASAWLPSQNGFVFDAPQRHSVARMPFASPATAFASRVLPVPGGPTSSAPFGSLAPISA